MGGARQNTAMTQPPFYDGPPRFDVGLKPITLAQWLLPDDQGDWLVGKNNLINTQGAAVFAALPNSEAAQFEAAHLIAEAIGGGFVRDEAPLLAASRLVSDDLVIMENVDGDWTNTACCLCNPTFFSAHFALGKSLALLHEPVPDGDFGLARRIGRVFTNLTPHHVLERHNWTVQWSDARYTPDGTLLREAAAKADAKEAQSQLFVRTERQTIRALPQTNGVLFTIRIRLTNLANLLANPHHRHAFIGAWQSAPEPVRAYKKWAVLERHVAALLASR
jgi:dimethylamine monooxygenase subunit A